MAGAGGGGDRGGAPSRSAARTAPTRRALLPLLGAGLGALAGGLALQGRSRAGEAVLRPPGARADFLAACIRCGLCAQACPVDAVELAGPRAGLELGAPRVTPRRAPCTLCQGHDELRCAAVCPTGALTPPPDWGAVRMGIAVLDSERCLAWNDAVCRACWHACPFPDRAIRLGVRARPEVVPSECVGCGLCVRACLTEPTSIEVLPEALAGALRHGGGGAP